MNNNIVSRNGYTQGDNNVCTLIATLCKLNFLCEQMKVDNIENGRKENHKKNRIREKW